MRAQTAAAAGAERATEAARRAREDIQWAKAKAQRAKELRERAMEQMERAREDDEEAAHEERAAERLVQEANAALLAVEQQMPVMNERNSYPSYIPHEITVSILSRMQRPIIENVKRIACVSREWRDIVEGGRRLGLLPREPVFFDTAVAQ